MLSSLNACSSTNQGNHDALLLASTSTPAENLKSRADNNENTNNNKRSCVDIDNGNEKKSKNDEDSKRPHKDPIFDFPANLVFDRNGNLSKPRSKQDDATTPQLWLHHDAAAKYCAFHFEPLNQYRKLGVITRRLTGENPIPLLFGKNGKRKKKFVRAETPPNLANSKAKPPTISMVAAKKIARQQALWAGTSRNEGQIMLDAQQIINDWAKLRKHGRIKPFWNAQGQIEASQVDLERVIQLLELGVLRDDIHKDEQHTMYEGLVHIPTDTVSILKSIIQLERPHSDFWNVPLVVCYAKVVAQNQLVLGIYTSRLLFECMTFPLLQIVMAAMDPASVDIVAPLEYPPEGDDVFAPDDKKIVYELSDDEDEDDYKNDLRKKDATIRDSTREDDDHLFAFSNAGFLKLSESLGNDISDWPKLERRLQEYKMKVPLMLHQIHGLCWMAQMERLERGINSILWEKRRFADGVGTYYYSPALGQARLFLGDTKTTDVAPPFRVRGGVLADEMGLGKTVQILALILATRDHELAKEDGPVPIVTESTSNRTTLIVVPPALVNQWMTECQKIVGDALIVEYFDPRTCRFIRQQQSNKSSSGGNSSNAIDIGSAYGMMMMTATRPADVVITTYSALEKKKKGNGASDAAARILKSRVWGRVVLDEMQEIRSPTSSIANNCEGLQCSRRWMLSGTPLFEGIQDFRGELKFLGLEPFAANCEDGFFDFAISNPWSRCETQCLDILQVLSLVMLRRSKSMTIRATGLPLLGLKPLSLLFQPIPQDTSERAVYCFIESLIHKFQEIKTTRNTDSTTTGSGRRAMQRDEIRDGSLLGLLRDACLSPSLLPLAKINALMVEFNRVEMAMEMDDEQEVEDDEQEARGARTRGALIYGQPPERTFVQKPLSCNAAIRFLSQVMETARVGDDFVTNVAMGTGGGISRRARAIDLPEAQLRNAQEEFDTMSERKVAYKSKRAKANWFLLLEKVTTGELPLACYSRASSKFKSLWWLRCIINRQCGVGGQLDILPEGLVRGWRPGPAFYATESSSRAKRRWQWAKERILFGHLPSNCYTSKSDVPARSIGAIWRWRFVVSQLCPTFATPPKSESKKKCSRDLCLKWLHQKRPDFRWAHPNCFLLQNIPSDVTTEEVRSPFLPFCDDDEAKKRVDILSMKKEDTKSSCATWSAYVQFKQKSEYDSALKALRQTVGLQVQTACKLPFVEQEIENTQRKKKQAEAEYLVQPSIENKKKRDQSRTKFATAKLGLRMVYSKSSLSQGHVLCAPSIMSLRDCAPRTSSALTYRYDSIVDKMTDLIADAEAVLSDRGRQIERLTSVMERGLDSSLQAQSAFDTLQLLQVGNRDDTQCMVCFEPLGMGRNSRGIVALTPCGHLFCKGCISGYYQEKLAESGNRHPPCMMCRKPVHYNQIKDVDPDSKSDDEAMEKRRNAAQVLVEQAAELLKNSDGQLSAELWDAIYLTRELPPASKCANHPTYTAIPTHFLGHLRHTESMVHSSKIRALLNDLPRDELSVVFASSKVGVKLLLSVLDETGIGARGLFNGQAEGASKRAILEWESGDGVSVLVVQSGAAACGLTLTAACKMFIVEPFMKHEEEKQAYARLHRYGQTKPVEVKIYYNPVSVESRLLEWRKRAQNNGSTQEKIIFGSMIQDTAEDDNEEETQTRFLLGLDNKTDILAPNDYDDYDDVMYESE